MLTLLNGRDASSILAQSTSERVYAYSSTSTSYSTQSNIWNRPVKIIHLGPLQDPLSHAVHAIAEGHVTTVTMPSSSLLSSIPYLYKLASDRSSVVIHVSAGSCTSFADFTQVMSVRESGVAFMSASSVQEVYDLSLIAHVVSLLTSTPFLNFFDSTRISDEFSSIQLLETEHLLEFFPQSLVEKFKSRSSVPETCKQSAYLKYKGAEKRSMEENEEKVIEPSVYNTTKDIMHKFSNATGRLYHPLEYTGHPEAECVIVSMGAGATVVEKTLNSIQKAHTENKFGALRIRLYRPLSEKDLLDALPSTVQNIAVLEPIDDSNSCWNPLFLDVAAAYQVIGNDDVEIISGQYGVKKDSDLSPDMVLAVFQGLVAGSLNQRFEVAYLDWSNSHIEVAMPPYTDQLVFIECSSLAMSFAQSPGMNVQLYTKHEKCETHVRLTESEGTFLPSLIQSADALIIHHLPLSGEENQAIIKAIEILSSGGYLIIGTPFDLESSLSVNMKNTIYKKQIKIVAINNIDIIFKQSKTLSDIVNNKESTVISIPSNWTGDTNDSSVTIKNITLPKKPNKSFLPIETPYLQALNQVFGSRLHIYNAYCYDSAWSPNKSHNNSATPEFGYGCLINRIQERSRFVHSVIDIIQNASSISDEIRILSQWLLLVNSTTCSFKSINEAADLVKCILPSFPSLLSKEELLYETSNWLVGSDTWGFDLGLSGLHHIITSGENVNILIVDTTPYSSQTEREQRKKDIGLYAMNYGSVYVASVALYSSYTGVLQALIEADAYKGTSIVLAYLPQTSDLPDPIATLKETKISVDNGAWPLYCWNPVLEAKGEEMFTLYSQRIKKDLEAFLARENYLTQLVSSHPDISNTLVSSLENDTKNRHYKLKSKARADYARLISGMSSSQGPPLTVLFGSDNGNGESVARKIAARAKLKGAQVKMMAMDDYGDITELANESNLVIICSTTGQGEMPFNAREFWKSLNNLVVGDINLLEVNIAVFGLGDSHYWPRKEDVAFYNRPGKLLDAKFEVLGASKLVSLGLGDDQDDDGFQTGLSTWLPALWKALNIKDTGTEEEKEPIYTDDQMKIDSNYLRGDIAKELVSYSTGAISEITQKLIKFHGAYAQDDRDLREERKKQGLEKAYSFMIRVRTPGGVATSKQWIAMDDVSNKFGNKTLKLTTRQSFQLHGVLKKNVRSSIRAINKSLLSTLGTGGDVCRNIMSTPITEIPEIHGQVQTLVKELVDILSPKTSAYHEIWLNNSMVAGKAIQDFEPLYGPTYLPQKFKVVIAVPPNNDVDVYAHDLGYIAIVDTNTRMITGYNVLIGGGMGMTHGNKKTYPRTATLIGYIPANAAVEITKAVVLTQRDRGDRINRKNARFKYTVDKFGVAFIKKEIEEKSGVKFEKARPFSFDDNIDRYGWTKGLCETWNFCMFIENGRVKDSPEFRCKSGLRELARFHKGEFRLTPNQNLIICNIPESDLEKTKAHLAKFKLDNLSFTGIRKTSMACVALPTCGLAMAESERYLPQLISLLEDTMEEAGLREDSIVTRMTGCPNGCSRPYLAEMAFVGKAPDTYNMYLGGSKKGERLNKLYLENLREEGILNEVKPMIKRYALERNENEAFGDWVIRAGYIKETTMSQ
ncbi:hypothetical protein EDC94DRAFT_624736 [Helicostylum pulchrum]|nr:hypothetical protein EDC94DRAFT_624736 [Helicostylum pulchrum]